MEDRLTKIETLLAHHDQQIQDLNEIVLRQRGEIGVLQKRLERTQTKLLDLEAGADEGPGEALSTADQALRDKPPHY